MALHKVNLLRTHTDLRGDLVPVEFSGLPFTPKRIFYIRNVPVGIKRGGHGHKKCKQFYICLSGIIEVKLYKKGRYKPARLAQGDCVYVENNVWSQEQFLTPDAMLLVLCSHKYDKNDYYTDKK